MNLIDKYVAEVGKHLPLLKGREDIEKELKSTLEDMLEDKAEQAGRPRDEAMEIELLKEYGSPQKIASTYNTHPYLIGPRMFPTFLKVLKLVLSIVVIVLLVITVIQAATATSMQGPEFLEVIGKVFGTVLSAAVAVFGNVVLVFAILERTLPEKEIGDLSDNQEWDPASLAKEPSPDMIKRGEMSAEIVFTIIGLVVLNFYPQILGLNFTVDGKWVFVPILSEAFFGFLPWINLILLVEVILNTYLLRANRWSIATRVGKIIIEGVSLAITVILLRTPGLLGFTADSFANSPISAETAQTLVTVLNSMLPIALTVVLIIQGIEMAKALYGLLRINYKTK